LGKFKALEDFYNKASLNKSFLCGLINVAIVLKNFSENSLLTLGKFNEMAISIIIRSNTDSIILSLHDS